MPMPEAPSTLETFTLGRFTLPRLWNGLWQLSSNAWGSAPTPKIKKSMEAYVQHGYTAFADHYGSSEILFGQFRNARTGQEKIFGATKWCVFRPTEPTRELVGAAIQERLDRTQSPSVDLLQFHWQNYADRGYMTALQHLVALRREGKISEIGLCNFDASTMDEICTKLGPGIIVSNQVQFSLIDTRPMHDMAAMCKKHNVKLLTYGTLCGGFLADRWLNQPEPDLYATGTLTPSQRKYLDIILKVWGDWKLFQALLSTLRAIGDRQGGVSIANVATRWVLDHDFVGAVIIGTRLGISDHTSDNSNVMKLKLTDEDRAAIDEVLQRSDGPKLIRSLGDCGAEYR
ncbi:NADP-dependent oxidoreductase domain-containing protein [Cristinia sonorae]|uniref:NADP-dependent oxidoreductase domain-containing protein n=1 Tax=Cristinia sonorae TaxID=1940300 RepID=A0A8K0V0L8_9AGAR|nr:NADP-dependent oxidoreductase domain-containing protein [Cristinia sonorae]